MKKIIILFICLFATVCNVFALTKTEQRVIDSWKGENINSVIEYWGYPSKDKKIAGKQLYYWNTDNAKNRYYQGYYYKVYCYRILEADSNNIVIGGEFKGNNCTFIPYFVKKLANPNKNYWIDKKLQKNDENIDMEKQ